MVNRDELADRLAAAFTQARPSKIDEALRLISDAIWYQFTKGGYNTSGYSTEVAGFGAFQYRYIAPVERWVSTGNDWKDETTRQRRTFDAHTKLEFKAGGKLRDALRAQVNP